MKIAIDIDDVLANFIPSLIEFHNRTYATNFKKEDLTVYHFWEVWGGTREEAIDKTYQFYETPEFINLPLIEGAQEGIARLRQSHDLVAMTARPDILRSKTENWIAKHFPNMFSDIHIANRFSKSGPSTTKAELCEKHAIDMLIDDNLEYARQCATPQRKILLFNNPWNQHQELPHNVHRVYSWEEIPRHI